MGRRVLICFHVVWFWTAAAQAQTPMSPAWIEVRCPADVVLVIGGQRMETLGTHRRFATPPLPTGELFTYQVEGFQNEQAVAVRTVQVQAGQTSLVVIEGKEEPARPRPVPPGKRKKPALNFGIDLEELARSAVSTTADSGSCDESDGAGPPVGDSELPDPRRPRLTIIGNQQQRKEAVELLNGPLKEIAKDYVIGDYAPDHWAIARAGFVTTGQPTVYAQEADGRVLFRQDDLADLEKNLKAVRKPSPHYLPERDPDHRRGTSFPVSLQDWLPWFSMAIAGWFLWRARRSGFPA